MFRQCKNIFLSYSKGMQEQSNWAGRRLGLPAEGSGSIAKMGRRTLGICIDWAISSLVGYSIAQSANSEALTQAQYQAALTSQNLMVLGIFALQQWLLVATLGFSIGHRIVGIAVRRLDGRWVGFWRSFIRVGLILLVLPVTIWDADNRGLHDKAVGTVLVRI
jgi:uncharacterized RDD family membrane protein YckC